MVPGRETAPKQLETEAGRYIKSTDCMVAKVEPSHPAREIGENNELYFCTFFIRVYTY